jgi:hypothetical protein
VEGFTVKKAQGVGKECGEGCLLDGGVWCCRPWSTVSLLEQLTMVLFQLSLPELSATEDEP